MKKCQCDWCKISRPVSEMKRELEALGQDEAAKKLSDLLDYAVNIGYENDGLKHELRALKSQ